MLEAMSDIGFSHEYDVYITEENGIQIVANELSLLITREMKYRSIKVSDIADTLGISKSTVKDRISKLKALGIVSEDRDPKDKRINIYNLNAALLFSSEEDIDWQLSARNASTSRILENGQCTFREDLSLYAASLTEMGVNIFPGLFGVGEGLIGDGKSITKLENVIKDAIGQCNKSKISIDIGVNEGLRLEFISDQDISDLPLVISPMLGILISTSQRILGYQLAYDISLSVRESGHRVKIIIPRFEGSFNKELQPGYFSRIKNFRPSDDFSIYATDTKSILFTNKAMMAILDMLVEGPASMKEMEEKLGIPAATIYSSVMKLYELKTVSIDLDSQNVRRYKLDANPVLSCSDSGQTLSHMLPGIIDDFVSKRRDYYSSVILFARELYSSLGIRFDRMYYLSGANTAKSVLEFRPDLCFEEFVDMACSMVSFPDRVEVLGLRNVCLRVILSKDTLWDTWPSEFVRGFLSEGVKRYEGVGNRVFVQTVREGDDDQGAPGTC